MTSTRVSQMPDQPRKRIIELDFFRGTAILLMIVHHFMFDLRHVFGLDVLAFQDTVWFMDWIRPVILYLFLTVSGISCSFSRNNFKRALRTGLFALGITLTFEAVSYLSKSEMHIYFNVFHLVTLGILFYAFLTFRENKASAQEEAGRVSEEGAVSFDRKALFLMLLGMVTLYLGTAAAESPFLEHNCFLIFGLYSRDVPGMADYLPIFPWFGMFLIGAAAGRIFYKKKKSLLSSETARKMEVYGRPLAFMGRHPLWLYALHQPIMLGIMAAVLKLLGKF